MSTSQALRKTPSKRSPLSVWELPMLMKSVHRHRKAMKKPARERKHFRAILAFVHRNRFAVANQIQRRFSNYLKSDRTTRRHLVEMESLGFLGVVDTNNTSPLWPKVYFVTRCGLTKLRKALLEQGHEWSESSHDRRRTSGMSAQHVLHELFITEFLLMVLETTQIREDLQVLTTQRRSLAKHDSFQITVAGRRSRLQPDGMFLYRHRGKGMMCCFVEMDLDSMSLQQMSDKFCRYQLWSESSHAQEYLKQLYAHHGAANPAANFRILVVVGSKTPHVEHKRLTRLLNLIAKCKPSIRDRIWLCGVGQLQSSSEQQLLNENIWVRPQLVSFDNGEVGLNDLPILSQSALFGIR